ncbi:MAG: hypothetical protein AAFS10_12185, partial [Myxococcota bacterium]
MHSKATLIHPHLCAFLSITALGLGCNDAQQTRYTNTVIGTNNGTSDVFNTATSSEDGAIAEGSMPCAEASDCSGPGPGQCATPFGGWECVEGRCEVTCAAIPDNICDELLAELPEQLDAASSCTQNSDCTVWNNPLYCAMMSPPLSDCDFYTTANTPERAALDDLLGDLVANACAEAQGNCGGCLEPPS